METKGSSTSPHNFHKHTQTYIYIYISVYSLHSSFWKVITCTFHTPASLACAVFDWLAVRAKWKSRKINKDAKVMNEGTENDKEKDKGGRRSKCKKRRQRSTLLCGSQNLIIGWWSLVQMECWVSGFALSLLLTYCCTKTTLRKHISESIWPALSKSDTRLHTHTHSIIQPWMTTACWIKLASQHRLSTP